MPADPEPPALADLVAFAERSRTGDWSLRSALVRYAQGEPRRVGDLLEVVRRLEAGLHTHGKTLRTHGPAVWAAVDGGLTVDGPLGPVVELVRAAVPLDRLAEVLTAWAEDRTGPRPDQLVDEATREVSLRLDELGIPREERSGPPGGRSR